MIEIKDKKECCGCGACSSICPVQCIHMERDAEGFLYPAADKTVCTECGLCEKVCPVLHAEKDDPFPQAAYLLQYKNEKVRRQSTSGGAFTAIARYVTDRGGLVYGAAFDPALRVHHQAASSPKQLAAFRNSKYVQSDTEKTFSEVREHLRAGRFVCYSGTPCQIEGLLRFLDPAGKNGALTEHLLTVDVVCHAVPSPLVWERYLEMQKKRLGTEVADAKFRDKHYGYQYSTMTLTDRDGTERYVQGIDTDQMLRAFFSNICDRPSCYDCAFKKRYRKSDFTLWDCYPVYQFDKKLDDDRGTSRVLIHTQKGRDVFEQISERCRVLEVDPDKLTDGVREMFFSVGEHPRRKAFFEDAVSLEAEDLFDKYFPVTVKTRLERAARLFCYRTGILGPVKRAAKWVLKKG